MVVGFLTQFFVVIPYFLKSDLLALMNSINKMEVFSISILPVSLFGP